MSARKKKGAAKSRRKTADAGPSAAAPIPQEACVLITTSDAGFKDCGSGFVVRRDTLASYVVTCAHVLEHWDPSAILVNGRPASVLTSVAQLGLDLALLRVPGIHEIPLLPVGEFVRDGALVWGWGFRHLHRETFLRDRFDAVVNATLATRTRTSKRDVATLELIATRTAPICPGNSGGAVLDALGEVVAVVSHTTSIDEKKGITGGLAISASALRAFLDVAEGLPPPPPPRAPEVAPVRVTAPEVAPEPGPVTDFEDPQSGRFGGASRDKATGVSVKAVLHDVEKGKDYFFVDLVVSAPNPDDLVGPAHFYLHDSYSQSHIVVKKKTGGAFVLPDIYTTGVYVAGAQVRMKDRWVAVEVDLRKLVGLPKKFLSR